MPLEVVSDLKQDPALTGTTEWLDCSGILLNPAPPKNNDTLNPFHFREVRYAVNYLVNREFVVDDRSLMDTVHL